MAYQLFLLKSGEKLVLIPGQTLTLPANSSDAFRIIDTATGRSTVRFQKQLVGKHMVLDLPEERMRVVLTEYQSACDAGNCPRVFEPEFGASTARYPTSGSPETAVESGTFAAQQPVPEPSTYPMATSAETPFPPQYPTSYPPPMPSSTNSGASVSPLVVLGGVVLLAGIGAAVSAAGSNNADSTTPSPSPAPSSPATAPTIAVTASNTILKSNETIVLTFNLSQSATDFTQSDVVVTGGSLSQFSGSGTTYTAVFTPATGSTAATIQVGSNAFSNASNLFNSDGADSNNLVNLSITPVAPTIALSVDKTTVSSNQTTAHVSFTLSDASTDFSLADVTVVGGALSNFTGSATDYSATLALATGSNLATVRVGNYAFSNAWGIFNADSNDTNNQASLALDNTPPTVAISVDKSSLNSAQTATISFNFSEAVANFTLAAVSVTGGTLSNLTGSGTSYSATFTPSPTATNANIRIASNAFTDLAGNANVDGNDSNNQQTLAISQAPVITTAQLDYTQVENAATGTVLQATGGNISTWSLSGADASKFTIDSNGVVKFIANTLDFENPQDANHDGIYQLTLNGTSSLGTAAASKNITIRVTDVTELPTWLQASAPYGTTNAGVQSLLSADGVTSGWGGTDGSATHTPVALTYAFENAGAVTARVDGSYGIQFIEGSFNADQKAVIRTAFQNFSDVANITLTENQSQTSLGADIRLFTDTAAHLGWTTNTLAFTYLPSGSASRTTDLDGNFYFISDSVGMQNLSSPAFTTPYADERHTIIHELGHAMGLDHPFGGNDPYASGFYAYDDTASGHTATNDYGAVTGGGHDSPLTDTSMESVMTYHNPDEGPVNNLLAQTTLTSLAAAQLSLTSERSFAPSQLSIYDIAALQNLYGANLTVHTGDDQYTFDQNTPSYATIWDGGGNDTITSVGSNAALINLNEGSLSRVGATPGWVAHFTDTSYSSSTISSATLTTPSNGIATVDADGHGFTFTANEQPGGFDGTLAVRLTYTNGQSRLCQIVDLEPAVTDASSLNLGIAFGVTIENAVGGSGNDTLIGNAAPNHLTGGLGNDTLTGGGGGDTFIFNDVFGNDTITDFVSGQDVIQLASKMASAAVSFSNHTLSVAGYGSIQLAGVASLLSGVDYVYV